MNHQEPNIFIKRKEIFEDCNELIHMQHATTCKQNALYCGKTGFEYKGEDLIDGIRTGVKGIGAPNFNQVGQSLADI